MSNATGLPTEAELPRSLFWLALPVLGEQLLVFCVGLFDVWLAGQLGANETSAIGLAAYVGWMAALLFGLIRNGVAAIVARCWGAGDFAEAERVLAKSLFLATWLGCGLWLVLQLGAPVFARLLGMQGETRAIAIEYLRLDAYGQLLSCLTMLGAAALRGTGDMRTPLAVLAVTNVVNMGMSTALVYGLAGLPRWGVSGIVAGTVIAQACGACLMLWALMTGVTRLRLHPRQIGWDRAITARIVRVGLPAMFDGIATFIGHFLFLMVIARLSQGGFKSATFAAHIVGVRVEALSYLPAEAWGLAAASLSGRFLGASQPLLAQRVGWIALRQFLWYPLVMTVVFVLGRESIFAIMQPADPDVGAAGVPAMLLLAVLQIPNACLIILICTLRGAGATTIPLFCAIGSVLGVRVPVAYVCGVLLEGGLIGAWTGMACDNLLRATVITWYFARGHWTRIKV